MASAPHVEQRSPPRLAQTLQAEATAAMAPKCLLSDEEPADTSWRLSSDACQAAHVSSKQAVPCVAPACDSSMQSRSMAAECGAISSPIMEPAACSIAAGTCTSAECGVCWESDAHIVFLPCSHLCTCQTCAQAFLTSAVPCPMCRSAVASTVAL